MNYMPFIDDVEKMRDFVELTRSEFLKSYSYLTEEEYDLTAKALWEELGDVCVDEEGRIDTDWRIFQSGTSTEEIWHWFEWNLGVCAGKLMNGDDDYRIVPSNAVIGRKE